MDILDGGPGPRRGDIVQTNVGTKRERTWMVLSARKVDRRVSQMFLPPRYRIWMERWWELEADFRLRLYQSAERAGGQRVHWLTRYKPKKKKRSVWAMP